MLFIWPYNGLPAEVHPEDSVRLVGYSDNEAIGQLVKHPHSTSNRVGSAMAQSLAGHSVCQAETNFFRSDIALGRSRGTGASKACKVQLPLSSKNTLTASSKVLCIEAFSFQRRSSLNR